VFGGFLNELLPGASPAARSIIGGISSAIGFYTNYPVDKKGIVPVKCP
jgi:hypothetical protein